MTVIAGLPGKGVFTAQQEWDAGRPYVVLAADSEEGGYVLKTSARKIITIDKETCKCVVGGAGGGHFIDFAIQEVERRLTPPFTLDGVRERIEEIVTDIHEDRIGPLKNANNEFELLCAIWVRDEGLQLVRISNHISVILPDPVAIGTGDELAKYLLAIYSWPVSLYHATRLAVYLISQVKASVMHCGGRTQVVWIDGAGVTEQLQEGSIAEHEKSNSAVMAEAARSLLYLADPAGWGYDLNQLDTVLTDISRNLRERLKAAHPQLKPLSPEAGRIMDEMPSLPPSGSSPAPTTAPTPEQRS